MKIFNHFKSYLYFYWLYIIRISHKFYFQGYRVDGNEASLRDYKAGLITNFISYVKSNTFLGDNYKKVKWF
ncbi:hypothetical protein [Spiroplasma helicoides]|uniref:hypothetical protein n=1 Tax=Spiroplasma helicoides TaxID=216938 RepID=UPI00083FCA79|nr:hypothetical protein [Spiroplasma helicoides]